MIPKPLKDITSVDIAQLIENKVSESRTLEYKQTLPGGSDTEKKEFLADICAFANANGGDLLYGIEGEKNADGTTTGLPKEVVGVNIDTIDALSLKLSAQIQTGIAPRIAKVEIISIGQYKLGPVVIVRIPQSWAHPHWVTYKKDPPFYMRNSSGKYPMDIGEVRAAFSLNGMLKERVKEFREDRINMVMTSQTPVALTNNTPKVILHIIPAQFLAGDIAINSREYAEGFKKVAPMAHTGWNNRYNFDGIVNFHDNGRDVVDGYSQYFSNGSIEIVSDKIVTQPRSAPGNNTSVPSLLFERSIIASLTDGIDFLKNSLIAPPYFICLTLIGVKGKIMYTHPSSNFDPAPIDRDVLMIPEFAYDENSPAIELFLHPIFNYVWRASGLPASPNYAPNGERVNF